MPKSYPSAAESKPPDDRKWQIEDDVRTLDRAAEVVADRVRLRSAMSTMRQKHRNIGKMVDVLSRRRVHSGVAS